MLLPSYIKLFLRLCLNLRDGGNKAQAETNVAGDVADFALGSTEDQALVRNAAYGPYGPVGTIVDVISDLGGCGSLCVGVAVVWPSGLRLVHRWGGSASSPGSVGDAEVLYLKAQSLPGALEGRRQSTTTATAATSVHMSAR